MTKGWEEGTGRSSVDGHAKGLYRLQDMATIPARLQASVVNACRDITRPLVHNNDAAPRAREATSDPLAAGQRWTIFTPPARTSEVAHRRSGGRRGERQKMKRDGSGHTALP